MSPTNLHTRALRFPVRMTGRYLWLHPHSMVPTHLAENSMIVLKMTLFLCPPLTACDFSEGIKVIKKKAVRFWNHDIFNNYVVITARWEKVNFPPLSMQYALCSRVDSGDSVFQLWNFSEHHTTAENTDKGYTWLLFPCLKHESTGFSCRSFGEFTNTNNQASKPSAWHRPSESVILEHTALIGQCPPNMWAINNWELVNLD